MQDAAKVIDDATDAVKALAVKPIDDILRGTGSVVLVVSDVVRLVGSVVDVVFQALKKVIDVVDDLTDLLRIVPIIV